MPLCVFLRGDFVGLKLFLVGIPWIQNFFSWVFRGSKFFSRGFFVANFVIQRIPFVSCMSKNDRK